MAYLLRFTRLAGPPVYSHLSHRSHCFPAIHPPHSSSCRFLYHSRSSGIKQMMSPTVLRTRSGGRWGGMIDKYGGSGQNRRWISDDRRTRTSDREFPGFFLSGWRSRVAKDPQFPFKVLMEQIVGVTACVLGDMASRPNFGLNELDFVFSTLVVSSILNFTLMYLLAPTAGSPSPVRRPGIFSGSPKGHMFEAGRYTLLDRFGTFIFKGAVFAAVGFVAGFAGTAISNGLIKLRKEMDPEFEPPNEPPPTLLNSLTWAAHMGLSSNLRYQTLNGVEFQMAKSMSPTGMGFRSSVVVLRCLNNVLGGMSFVLLARFTGSQKAASPAAAAAAAVSAPSEVKETESHLSEGITE